MKHEVLLTAGAEKDLEEIFDYIVEFDTPGNANHVLDQLLKVADSLAAFPERGSYPKNAGLGYARVSPCILQALPPYLSRARQACFYLPDSRRQTRYAVAVVPPVADGGIEANFIFLCSP